MLLLIALLLFQSSFVLADPEDDVGQESRDAAKLIVEIGVQRNENRNYDLLDGIWTFLKGNDTDENLEYHKFDLSNSKLFPRATRMPVPSAYNDLSFGDGLRTHTGNVWYQRRFTISSRTKAEKKAFILRFDSVNYFTTVYLNKVAIGTHEGGQLPFEIDITERVKAGRTYRLTLKVNNELNTQTLPQADIITKPAQSKTISQYGTVTKNKNARDIRVLADGFFYGGILGSVYLHKLPRSFIRRIYIEANTPSNVKVEIECRNCVGDLTAAVLGPLQGTPQEVSDVNFENGIASKTERCNGVTCTKIISITLNSPRKWRPIDKTNRERPILYHMMVTSSDDVFRVPYGHRYIHIKENSHGISINDENFYCKGAEMRKDSTLRGSGFDRVTMTKDFNLLEWMGANCLATAHYPFSDEHMHETDRRGMMVINDNGLEAIRDFDSDHYYDKIYDIQEPLLLRDRSHPSVLSWGIARDQRADFWKDYGNVAHMSHQYDRKDRLTTIRLNPKVMSMPNSSYINVASLSLYFDPSASPLEVEKLYRKKLMDFKDSVKRPIMLNGYTMKAGSRGFSNEFEEENAQYDRLPSVHKVIDDLNTAFSSTLTGELYAEFCDFVPQFDRQRDSFHNRGLFTRDRQPKPAAYLLKDRYSKPQNLFYIVTGK